MNRGQEGVCRSPPGKPRAPFAGVPDGYQRTELGLLPAEWSICSVGELFDYLRTASNSRADLDGTGDTAYVHYGDIHICFDHFIDFSRDDVPRLSADTRVAAALLRNGDLIVADASEDEAGVGKSVEIRNLGTTKAVSGLHTFLLRPKNRCTSEGYRGYLFEGPSVKEQLRSLATGLKVFGISKGTLKSVLVPLPPPSEQRAIAKALSDVDGLLETVEELIAKKRTIKLATMQQLLTGRVRLPGFTDEWKTIRLGDIGTFSKGHGIRRDEVSQDGFPCIRYGEIYTKYETCVIEPGTRVSSEVASSALPIKAGDILFAGSGETAEEIGRCIAYLGEDQAYAGGDIVVLTPVAQNSLFLGYLLNHSTVAAQKARLAQGDAVVHIHAANLAQVQIALPSIDEQTAIAAVLSDMDAEIGALERRRDKVRAVKQGMMEQLLTGRVRLV